MNKSTPSARVDERFGPLGVDDVERTLRTGEEQVHCCAESLLQVGVAGDGELRGAPAVQLSVEEDAGTNVVVASRDEVPYGQAEIRLTIASMLGSVTDADAGHGAASRKRSSAFDSLERSAEELVWT